MKRTLMILTGILVLGISTDGFARSATTRHKRKSGKWTEHHLKMMSHMMGKKLLATEDGGVVVMVGNRLYKYDSSLKLIGEAMIPMMKGSCGMMGGKKDGCAMMKDKCGMMSGKKDGSGKSKDSTTMSDHESHHKSKDR